MMLTCLTTPVQAASGQAGRTSWREDVTDRCGWGGDQTRFFHLSLNYLGIFYLTISSSSRSPQFGSLKTMVEGQSNAKYCILRKESQYVWCGLFYWVNLSQFEHFLHFIIGRKVLILSEKILGKLQKHSRGSGMVKIKANSFNRIFSTLLN